MELAPASSSNEGAAAHAGDAEPGARKRQLAGGHAGERASKRRRMGQAAVLCMRELFGAVVKDGNITDAERLVLQNAATLLSQVEGNTWVSFADTEGSVRELTPQQVKKLRPFLDSVARELREHEVQLFSIDDDNREVLDCLQLASVPWADGITAHELLGCCGPEDQLIFESWLEKATAALPTQYMFRSRVRELLNHYYLRRGAAPAAPRRRSLLQRAEDSGVPAISAAAPFVRRCCSTAVAAVRAAIAPCYWLAAAFTRAWATAASAVAATVVALTAGVVDAAAPRVLAAMPSRLLRSREPVWPALRFFLAAFLHGQLRKLFKVLVLITSWRVVLCLAACSELLGWLFHPVVRIAEMVLNWKSSSRIWGCACFDGDDPSVLSWVPVKASDLLINTLKLCRRIPMPSAYSEGAWRLKTRRALRQGERAQRAGRKAVIGALDVVHPMVSILFDFTFSVGIARGLGAVVDLADESAQQKLVWMSMNIARIIRDGPAQDDGSAGSPAGGGEPALPGGGDPAEAAPPAAEGGNGGGGEPQLPAWNEEATWNLFDTE